MNCERGEHVWQFVRLVEGPPGDMIMSRRAEFVCQCGKFKSVDAK